MCPLAKHCPGYLGGKARLDTTPIGANCKFAHTHNELQFAAEIKSRRNMLLGTLAKINEMEKGPKIVPWNPSGNLITSCIGCGEALEKEHAKGNCSQCRMIKAIIRF